MEILVNIGYYSFSFNNVDDAVSFARTAAETLIADDVEDKIKVEIKFKDKGEK